MMFHEVLQQAAILAERGAPEDWAEAIVTIIVGVLSWWLGRERGKRKR